MKVLFPFFLIALLSSCALESDSCHLSFVTHNAYCFFDGSYLGNEYEGFDPKSGYDLECYEQRVKDYAEFMINSFSGYDVILLQEIEGSNVLLDLLDAGLKRKGYLYYGAASLSDGYLSVGFISKLKPEDVVLHGTEGSRRILELVFNINGELIHLVNVHLSSRLAAENESKRHEELSLLLSIIEQREGNLVVVMGDFNVDLKKGDSCLALKGSLESLSSPIVLTGDGGECGKNVCYSPAVDKMESLGDGTYFHEGEWSFIDSALITGEAFDWHGLEYHSSRIVAPGSAKDGYGFPKRFNAKDGSGFSDHFAFGLEFVF